MPLLGLATPAARASASATLYGEKASAQAAIGIWAWLWLPPTGARKTGGTYMTTGVFNGYENQAWRQRGFSI